MLVYFNRSFFRVLLCRYGSVFLRADSVSLGLFFAGLAVVLQSMIDDQSDYAPRLPHHYCMLSLGGMVGFATIFRANLGWARYWEAVGQLHIMYSKWTDVFAQILAFSSVTIETALAQKSEQGDAKAQRVEEITERIHKNMTILSAMAADRLTHGDTNHMEVRSNLPQVTWDMQLVKREALRAGPDITGASAMPMFEVTELPMRAQEFKYKKKTLRRFSLLAKVEKVKNSWTPTYRVRAHPTDLEHSILAGSADRTSVVMYWIIQDLAQVSADMESAVSSPIQSRMYQQLSDGMLGFSQAVKLSDVPFPFPYAQMLTLLLICYTCFIPIYIVCFTQSMIAGPIMSFCVFQGIWGLNETAKELENPFGSDVNDITLRDFHMRFLDAIDQVFVACTVSLGRKSLELKGRTGQGQTRNFGSSQESSAMSTCDTGLTAEAPSNGEHLQREGTEISFDRLQSSALDEALDLYVHQAREPREGRLRREKSDFYMEEIGKTRI